MRKLIPALGLLALALVLAAPASANPISGSSCLNSSCFGNVYTLTYNTTPVSTTATTTTYAVTLTIDTTNYVGNGGPIGVAITSVAIKVSPTVTSASLVSFPAGTAWTTVNVNTGLNASGCGGGGSGFVCTDATTPATLPHSGTYSWTFNVEVPTGTLITTALGASIKVGFTNAKGGNAGITSENIDLQVPGPGPNNPVPEPSSLALLGTGLVGVAGFIRRRLIA